MRFQKPAQTRGGANETAIPPSESGFISPPRQIRQNVIFTADDARQIEGCGESCGFHHQVQQIEKEVLNGR
jgi:hypothetical protein